jgi:hypothetical protein
MSRALQTCQRKTAVGNRYDDPYEAVQAAISLNRKRGCRVHAYHCRVCKRFHVGNPLRWSGAK